MLIVITIAVLEIVWFCLMAGMAAHNPHKSVGGAYAAVWTLGIVPVLGVGIVIGVLVDELFWLLVNRIWKPRNAMEKLDRE